VEIPIGIERGSKILIKNKGNIYSGKVERGDLLIEISIKPHPIWKVKGLDVYGDLPIYLDELALGTNICLPYLEEIHIYQYFLEVYLSKQSD
tara:strand:+ start:34 stop:309 length:276 start_codon:yes stop_codon:yes gene_type:complete